VAGCEDKEIEANDLNPNYFSPIRVVIEVNHHLDIPHELRISQRFDFVQEGCVAKVLPDRIWPRREQLDMHSHL
jgi:hypothetical protein